MDAQPAAPPVVAVVVTHDPGPWFEEALRALGGQDYPNLSVLVLDAASAEDPTARVASVLPTAYVRRASTNAGFAATANDVLEVVEGASHFLLCHDDVAPDVEAVRLMVEEAYRSNAGIVAPKFVAWDDPRRLRSVGASADKGGAIASLIEPGELDQEQHDAVRDVFVAPGGCTLVRADLFASLGGFDPDMTLFGEDLDLSWRAQVAGARVVVAPGARVRHREALSTGERQVPPSLLPAGRGAARIDARDRIRPLQVRHRLRAVLKSYGPFHLVRVLPQLAVLNLVEMAYALVTGRRRSAGALAAGWTWNLRRLGQLRPLRRATQKARALPDGEVRRLQARGTSRLAAYLSGQLATEERSRALTDAGRELSGSFRNGAFQLQLVVYAVIALALLLGSRDLLGSRLPAIGQLAPFPDGPMTFLRHFGSGWRSAGLGSEAPAPAAFGVLGVAGILVLGAMSFLQKVLVLGALPLGLLGAARLARPLGSRKARTVAVAAYAAVPLPYDAIARGAWSGLVAYAAAPWILGHLFRATGLLPFGASEERPAASAELESIGVTPDLPPAPPASAGSVASVEPEAGGGAISGTVVATLLQDAPAPSPMPEAPAAVSVPLVNEPSTPGRSDAAQVVALGLLVALAAALSPALLLTVAVVALAVLAGSALTGRPMAGARAALVAVAALVVAAALLFPWSLDLLLPGGAWTSLVGSGPRGSTDLGFGQIVRFQTGPVGSGVLGYALAIVGALPLIVGQGWRLTWAARAWMIALACWLLAWGLGSGRLGLASPAPEVLLAPAAAAMSLAVALGMVAFETDLTAHRFGWRQVLSVVAALVGIVGALPVLGAVVDGRWHAPERDFAGQLSWMSEKVSEGPFRLLWLGDAEVLPLDSWELGDGLSYATSRNGTPTALELWAGAPRRAELLTDAVAVARRGETTRLGRLLAPMAVRYVVLPRQLAPTSDLLRRRLPPDLEDALRSQIDLRLVETDESVVVYENTSWAPGRASLTESAAAASEATGAESFRAGDLAGSEAILPREEGVTDFRGPLEDGTQAYLAESSSRRWNLEVGGADAPRRTAFGWANAFDVNRMGEGRLSFATPVSRWLALLVELVLVLAAVRFLLMDRIRRRSVRS